MNLSDRYFCQKCFTVFDEEDHKPRIIKRCLHTFCEKCILKLVEGDTFRCPDDSQVTDKIKSVEDFPINYELLRAIRANPRGFLRKVNNQGTDQKSVKILSSNTSSQRSESLFAFSGFCQLHSKRNELYCANHNQMICAQCALSQDHQGHIIHDSEQLSIKVKQARENIDEQNQHLKAQHLEFENTQKNQLREVQNILGNRHREALVLINQKFQYYLKINNQDIIDKLRSYEDQQIRKLGILLIKVEESIRQQIVNSQKEISLDIIDFHRRVDSLQMEDPIKVLNEENHISDHVNKIMEKLFSQSQRDKEQLLQIISNSMIVHFNPIHFEQFCVVQEDIRIKKREALPQQCLKSWTPQDKDLLAQSKASHYHQTNMDISRQIKTQDDIETHAYTTRLTFSTFQSKKKPRHQTPKSQSVESRVVERVRLQLTSKMECPKYVDRIDLSNQQLTDNDVEKLCEWLTQSEHQIEIIKLTKNRITDQGFSLLIRFLSQYPKVHTLNLTNNYCSDYAFEILQATFEKDKLHLKNIYLTNCRINSHKMKDHQDRFKTHGINVYL